MRRTALLVCQEWSSVHQAFCRSRISYSFQILECSIEEEDNKLAQVQCLAKAGRVWIL